MAKPYGMPDRDGAPAPKKKDSGSPECGLSEMNTISGMEKPVKEQVRWAAGERNESLPGGFKLTQ